MAAQFRVISEDELHVKNHVIKQDINGNWVSTPPITDPHISSIVQEHLNLSNRE